MHTLEVATGLLTEEILLEGDELDQRWNDVPSRTVQRRFVLKNNVRATQTEFVFFEEGYLGLRERGRGKRRAELLLDLRYLDPRPALARFVAVPELIVAAGLLFGGMVCAALAYLSVSPAFTVPAALCLMIAALPGLWWFLYRTHERVVFRTSNGQVTVFAVHANRGCLRACRALVPHIVKAINDARGRVPTGQGVYLRQEMREHYRLREAGVLTEDACATGTRRILAQFD
jgi:hypothetical protein